MIGNFFAWLGDVFLFFMVAAVNALVNPIVALVLLGLIVWRIVKSEKARKLWDKIRHRFSTSRE